MQASADHLDELAIGFLVSEGLLTDPDRLEGVEVDSRRGLIFVGERASRFPTTPRLARATSRPVAARV